MKLSSQDDTPTAGTSSPSTIWWLSVVLSILLATGGFLLRSTIEKQDSENVVDKEQAADIAALKAQRASDHETLNRIEGKIDQLLSERRHP